MTDSSVEGARQTLLGIAVDRVDKPGILAAIEAAVDQGRPGRLFNNVNIHAMNIAYQDAEFRRILNASDLVFVDGVGIKWGAVIAGIELGQRVTPADMLDDILRLCVRRQWPLFLLGDTDEVGACFEEKLRREHPDCPFAGRHHGFFDRNGADNQRVVELINASGAKIVLVAMSMPIQEKWAWHNREQLEPPVLMAVGGLARIYTGHIARGPRWMTDHGLEWLYRLAVQRRLVWRRYIIGNPKFLWRVLMGRLGLLGKAGT